MIEVNKNTLASALPALGKLICRTSPLMLCKSIKIESANGKLKLSTCELSEEVSYELNAGNEEAFSCMVGFDEFRDAVRGGRNKTVGISYETGVLLVGDRYLMTVKDVEWPDFAPHAEIKTCELPEGVIGMFARAAQVIDRSGARAILHGINLSSDGIAATNGKELVNYDLSLNLEDNLTIPLPLALIQSKAPESGTISYWQNGADYRFKIQIGAWNWIGKTISGMYPNWQQIIPKSDALTHEIKNLSLNNA